MDVDHVDGTLGVHACRRRRPSDASATACIVVRAEPDWVADGALFTYESETTGPPTPIDCPPPTAGLMTTAREVPRQGSTGGVAADATDDADDTRAAAARPPRSARPPLDLMKFITSIGSPIALATALLFYFGWVRSEEQARAFGADASVFAMSTQDYVLRSVNVLFFPLILMFLVVLLLLRLDRRLRAGPDAPPWLRDRRPAAAAVLAGVPAAGLRPLRGCGQVRRRTRCRCGWRCPWSLRPTAPSCGGVPPVTAAASRVTVGILVALVTVILFWQTERLASLGGEALAEDIKDNLGDRLTRVELFSVTNLHLDGPGVTTERSRAVEGEYGYRYSGLYLLQRSGDKYFLLTDGWDEDAGAARGPSRQLRHPRGVRSLIGPPRKVARAVCAKAFTPWFTRASLETRPGPRRTGTIVRTCEQGARSSRSPHGTQVVQRCGRRSPESSALAVGHDASPRRLERPFVPPRRGVPMRPAPPDRYQPAQNRDRHPKSPAPRGAGARGFPSPSIHRTGGCADPPQE